MIIGNNFQKLDSQCTHTINQIIFTINDHLVPINKLNKACTHQKIEFTYSLHGEEVISVQREVVRIISLLELSIKSVL